MNCGRVSSDDVSIPRRVLRGFRGDKRSKLVSRWTVSIPRRVLRGFRGDNGKIAAQVDGVKVSIPRRVLRGFETRPWTRT